MAYSYAEIAGALSAQWQRLDRWLSVAGDDLLGAADAPSSLPGWSNRELVIHLARAWSALTACEAAPDGTVPLALAEYLGTYPTRAAQIAQVTRDLAIVHHDLPLQAVRAEARAALDHLRSLERTAHERGLLDPGDLVVAARRAPIRLRDMVVSRLVELVVHAIDLSTSLAGVLDSRGDANPVEPVAAATVADELLRIVIIRGGWSLRVADPRTWIALATGRIPYDVDELARALEPQFTSDSVPDLGRMLPIL